MLPEQPTLAPVACFGSCGYDVRPLKRGAGMAQARHSFVRIGLGYKGSQIMNKALAAALFAALGVAGCGSTKEEKLANPAPCPNVVVLADAARMIEFDGDERIEDVSWTAEIEDVSLTCRYVAARPIDASMTINLAFGRGPKAKDEAHDFAYWVAVTRTNREVIEKKEYLVPVEFDSDDPIERVEHEIEEIVIPRKDESISGTNFEIIVGLVVTPQQAIYNRSGKSLKFPEL
jgi:hypothetical protein